MVSEWNNPSYRERASFSDLLGKTIERIGVIDGTWGFDEIRFFTADGGEYLMYHHNDCCESVDIDDIAGDIQQLVNDGPVLLAEEAECEHDVNPPGVDVPKYQESFTWTFYKLRTMHGSVTIRWYGASNGYYSESVDFAKRGRDDD